MSISNAETAALTAQQVEAALHIWADAVKAGNPSKVVTLYEPGACLLPTLAGEVHDTPELRQGYFNHFTAKIPVCKFVGAPRITIFGTAAIAGGLYDFTFKDGTKAQARYSFGFRKQEDGQIKIVHHHSSLKPA